MTNPFQGTTQVGDLNIKNKTTVEIVLSKLDATKIMTRNCHVDRTQIIHKSYNILETIG